MVDGLFLASSVARACLNNIEAIYVPKVVYVYMLYACMYMCVVYFCGPVFMRAYRIIEVT